MPAPKHSRLLVYVDIDGSPRLAGRLHCRVDGDAEHAEFERDRGWLKHPRERLLRPVLALPRAALPSGANMPLYGALGDSAPDRWGRTLMRRAERRRARRERREPRVLREQDFLVGVDDEVRAGSLRFARKIGGPFLGDDKDDPLPTIRNLPRLLKAVQAHEEGRETESQSRLLLTTGQLLGGSRPKASIRDIDGRLLIAKFPSRDDDRDMQRWEALTLGLAAECGIRVPAWRLESVDGERILLLERFDRDAAGRRIAFASAFGLTASHDQEALSQAAFAQVIRAIGARPQDDLAELWRRALFTVLVSNKDNHLRNHGMLLDAEGWRLAPAYDMNPEPQELRPRIILLSIDGVDDRASLDVAMSVAARFGVGMRDAKYTARSYAGVLRRWREGAKRLRLPAKEIHKMRDAFEHEDLAAALRA